ncbi:M60 family metallopeptidase [Pedobacter borealis]|uniref:M60 family metallopeptidase n=1 Tax=Pedobacter borealis TaxID=475254 RepID=UPI0004937753|nr:M60 family metallopeptidase [Pedobacter borealis]
MKKNLNLYPLLIVIIFSACRKNDPTFENLPKRKTAQTENASLMRSDITNPYYQVDSIGRNIQVVAESPSANSEKDRILNRRFPSDFYPTGFLLAPLDTLRINAEIVSGTSLPKLLIGTYQRYEGVTPQIVELKSGENKIVANKNGGIIWVRYSSSPMSSSKAKLTFVSGHKTVPVFVKNTTTLAQWQKLFEQADTAVHDVLLIGQRTNIVLPRTYAILKTQDNNSILDACDKTWDTEDDISGLDGSAPLHKKLAIPHLMVNRVYAGGAAWDYVTTYSYTSSFAESYAQNAWYQRHESGHQHQTAWDWDQEIMADFYAISTGMDWGLPKNLIARDGGWLQVWQRVKEYFNLPNTSRDYSNIWDGKNISTGERFRGSAMLIQLKLAFGAGFYQELHKQTRAEKPKLPDNASKYRYFMLKACNISGKDLTTFFRKWGFKDEVAYTEITKLNLSQPDIEPSSLTDDPVFTFN